MALMVFSLNPNTNCSLLLLSFSCQVMPDSFVILWIITCQAPLSMGFPRQECWSGLPFPSPGNLPRPGIKLMSSALAGGIFTTESPEKPRRFTMNHKLWCETVSHGMILFINVKPRLPQRSKDKQNNSNNKSISSTKKNRAKGRTGDGIGLLDYIGPEPPSVFVFPVV